MLWDLILHLSTRFPWDDETFYKPQGTWKGLTPTSGFLSLRKWYLQIWWEVAGSVSFWPEEQLKISDKDSRSFQKHSLSILRETIFWSPLIPYHSDKPVQSFMWQQNRQRCLLRNPLSSTLHSTSEHTFSASESESLLHCSFEKVYSASKFIIRSSSFLCFFLPSYLLISTRFWAFEMVMAIRDAVMLVYHMPAHFQLPSSSRNEC